MSLNQTRKDILSIYDLNPEWLDGLKYNPIREIINKGKSYHLISLAINVFGVLRANHIIKNINSNHYKQQNVINVIEEIKAIKYQLSSSPKKNQEDRALSLISLISKIDYFCVYSKFEIDDLIKSIIKNQLFYLSENLNYQSKLIFYIIKLNYKNIYIEKALKKIQSFQNKDGGWPLSVSSKNKDSDVFTSLLVHRCFLENSLWKNKDFLKGSERFLIKSHISKTNTSQELDRWNRIYVGYRKNNLFEGGTLLLLESLLLSDSQPRELKALLKWLKGLQLNNGFFPYHSKLKNQPNFTSTIKILSLFKKAYLMRNI